MNRGVARLENEDYKVLQRLEACVECIINHIKDQHINNIYNRFRDIIPSFIVDISGDSPYHIITSDGVHVEDAAKRFISLCNSVNINCSETEALQICELMFFYKQFKSTTVDYCKLFDLHGVSYNFPWNNV